MRTAVKNIFMTNLRLWTDRGLNRGPQFAVKAWASIPTCITCGHVSGQITIPGICQFKSTNLVFDTEKASIQAVL